MELCLLGPLEVLDAEGRSVPLGGAKQRSVLAVLALDANRVVSTDRLIAGVWGEDAAEGVRRSLQVYVSNLRQAFQEAIGSRLIETRAPGYVLEVDEDAIDLHRFRRDATEGRRLLEQGRAADAVAALDAAIGLWRGDVLGDLAFEPFASEGALDQIVEQRLAAVEDRIEAGLALGRHDELVTEIEALVAAHPLRERPWGQLMVALYRSGRQADALRAYGRARDVLVEELGIEPGPALRELESRILDQDPDLGSGARPAPATDGRPTVNLPHPTSPLIGRSHELEGIVRDLRDPGVRLLTLLGPGGVGKTRLSVAAAEEVIETFPGGVAFVALASAEAADQLLPSVARTLGVPLDAGRAPLEAIAERLGARPWLLVLDNLEQIVDAGPDVVALLGACPLLTVLVTSRIALRVSGEHEVQVPELESDDAVAMFVARSRARVPSFALTPDNAATVEEICERLDGLPLAIELAAARTKVLRPADLLARLADSLQVLVGGGRDLPDRHRTIRATLEWSYSLLTPPEQALLDRLSVFAGSFSLEGAEAVGGDDPADPVLDLLTTLVDNSLVRPVDTGIAMRFQLLGTVRDLARERLEVRAETTARRDQHAQHTLAAAREARTRLDGPEGTAATAELAADEPNHRAAFAHSLEQGDADTAAELAVALHPYRVAQGQLQESRAWLAAVLAEPALQEATRARALVAAGAAAYYQDDMDAAVPLLEDGLAASREADEPASVAVALCFLATSLASTGAGETAGPMAVEALELARTSDRYEPQVLALSVSAMLAGLAGDTPLEIAHHEERLALARRRGDRSRVADSLNTLAEIELDEGRAAGAAPLAEEALTLARTVSRMSARDSLLTLARVALAQGDGTRARQALDEALPLCVEFGQPFELSQCLRAAAATAAVDGAPERAATLFGAADAVRDPEAEAVFPVEPDLAEHRERARELLGDGAFAAAGRLGSAMELDAVVALATAPPPADDQVSAAASDRSPRS